jgi:hypothetical protein
MNRARLATLAAHLETVPRHRFDMGTWVRDEKSIKGGKVDPQCRTRACAGGWACSIPEFSKAGLHLIKDPDLGVTPAFRNSRGFAALEKFFDIEDGMAAEIFVQGDDNHYDDPVAVSRVIYNYLTSE